MGHLHAWEQEAVDLLYYLWKAYKAAPDEEFVIYIKDLKSQCDDGRATFTAEDLMVRAENKYEACLLDEENAWGKPTEEQEKIGAMSAEIDSLKKEQGSSSGKTNKPKHAAKKHGPKIAASKKSADKKKRPATSGPGKTSRLKNRTPTKMRPLLRLLKKSIIGVRIMTTERVCGPSTIQMIVRAAQGPIEQHPTPTSLLSTPWAVTWNDCCARVEASLGSG